MSDSDFEYDDEDVEDDEDIEDDNDIEDDDKVDKNDGKDDEDGDEDGGEDGDTDFQYTDTTFNTISTKIDRRKKRTFETTKTEISIFVKEIMEYAPNLIKVKDIDIIINILSKITKQLNHYIFVVAYISKIHGKLDKKNMQMINDRILQKITRKIPVYDVIRYRRYIDKL